MEITRGIKHGAPQRVLIYGPEGIGKSTLASHFPDPLFIDIEDGTKQLDVTRVTARSWRDIEAATQLAITQRSFRTLVYDTMDWAELYLIEHIISTRKLPDGTRAKSIEDFGYGKGWVAVTEEMQRFLRGPLAAALSAGMHVVLLAHTATKAHTPAGQLAYDRNALKLSKGSSGVVKEWVDAVLFGSWDLAVDKVNGKGMARGGKERVLYTTHDPMYDAKNRHGLAPVLPWCWESIAPIVESSPAPGPVTPPTKPQSSSSNYINPQLEPLDNVLDSAWLEAGTRYLQGTGKIAATQTIYDAPAEYLQKVIDNAEGFKRRVDAWHDAEAEAGR